MDSYQEKRKKIIEIFNNEKDINKSLKKGKNMTTKREKNSEDIKEFERKNPSGKIYDVVGNKEIRILKHKSLSPYYNSQFKNLGISPKCTRLGVFKKKEIYYFIYEFEYENYLKIGSNMDDSYRVIINILQILIFLKKNGFYYENLDQENILANGKHDVRLIMSGNITTDPKKETTVENIINLIKSIYTDLPINFLLFLGIFQNVDFETIQEFFMKIKKNIIPQTIPPIEKLIKFKNNQNIFDFKDKYENLFFGEFLTNNTPNESAYLTYLKIILIFNTIFCNTKFGKEHWISTTFDPLIKFIFDFFWEYDYNIDNLNQCFDCLENIDLTRLFYIKKIEDSNYFFKKIFELQMFSKHDKNLNLEYFPSPVLHDYLNPEKWLSTIKKKIIIKEYKSYSAFLFFKEYPLFFNKELIKKMGINAKDNMDPRKILFSLINEDKIGSNEYYKKIEMKFIPNGELTVNVDNSLFPNKNIGIKKYNGIIDEIHNISIMKNCDFYGYLIMLLGLEPKEELKYKIVSSIKIKETGKIFQ